MDNTSANKLTQRRAAATAPDKKNQVANKLAAQKAGVFQFYQDDQGGLRVSPTTVLICALIFMACVVSMHIVGKLRGV